MRNEGFVENVRATEGALQFSSRGRPRAHAEMNERPSLSSGTISADDRGTGRLSSLDTRPSPAVVQNLDFSGAGILAGRHRFQAPRYCRQERGLSGVAAGENSAARAAIAVSPARSRIGHRGLDCQTSGGARLHRRGSSPKIGIMATTCSGSSQTALPTPRIGPLRSFPAWSRVRNETDRIDMTEGAKPAGRSRRRFASAGREGVDRVDQPRTSATANPLIPICRKNGEFRRKRGYPSHHHPVGRQLWRRSFRAGVQLQYLSVFFRRSASSARWGEIDTPPGGERQWFLSTRRLTGTHCTVGGGEEFTPGAFHS